MSFNLIAAAASAVSQQHLAAPIDPPPASQWSSLTSHAVDAVSINPQPLPPREGLLATLHSRFDAVALNPQPLPPRESFLR